MYTSQQLVSSCHQQQTATGMLPSEYNAILQDMSSQMSRSDLLRRVSTHSCSTSDTNKRGSTRVTKQTSASSSPHYVQRRRTTANHSSRTHPRITHDSQYQTREQRLRTYYSAQESMPFQRPMSWHPGSDNVWSPGTYPSSNEPAVGNTIAGLESLAVSGTPDYSAQRSIQHAFAMGYGIPMKTPTVTHENSMGATAGYGTSESTAEFGSDSYPIYSISDPPHQPYAPQATTFNSYPTSTYQASQHWPLYGQGYPIDSQIPQNVPSYAPTQGPTSTARQPKASPKLARRKSKELVGMGLYDDRVTDCTSPAISENPNRDSLGKGLKLEETWQPPNEEEGDDDDDEAYSTDEAEEADEEEAPLSFMTSGPTEAQTAVYPTYGDLSNQSFFFNDDDEYHDNQYANIMAYGQGLSGIPSKAQANPATENYLWL